MRNGNYGMITLIHLSGIPLSFARGFVTILFVCTLGLVLHGTLKGTVMESGSGSEVLLVPFTALGAGMIMTTYMSRRHLLHVLFGGIITFIVLYLS